MYVYLYIMYTYGYLVWICLPVSVCMCEWVCFVYGSWIYKCRIMQGHIDGCHTNREKESLWWIDCGWSQCLLKICTRKIFAPTSRLMAGGWRATVVGPVVMKLLEMLKASIVSLQSGSVAAIFKGGTTCMFNYHCEFTISQTWMMCLKVRINWAQSRANLTWNINIHMQAPSCHHPTVPFPVEPLVPAPRPGASKKTRPSPTLKQSCSVLHGGFQKDGRVLETAPLHSCFPTVEVADHRGPSKMAGTY